MAALCLLLPSASRAGEGAARDAGYPVPLSEASIKAAFIANFLQFVTWPWPHAKLQFCSLGSHSAGSTGSTEEVLEALAAIPFKKSALAIRRLASVADLRECHAVFVPAAAHRSLSDVVTVSRRQPLLVISDIDGAAALGAMLGLVAVPGNRMEFDVNLEAARAAGLVMNARLLQLARRVY